MCPSRSKGRDLLVHNVYAKHTHMYVTLLKVAETCEFDGKEPLFVERTIAISNRVLGWICMSRYSRVCAPHKHLFHMCVTSLICMFHMCVTHTCVIHIRITHVSHTAQGWTNRTRTLISHEPVICSQMCFTKTESVQHKNEWYNILVNFILKFS